MTDNSNNLNLFEARLQSALHPVQPANNYVQSVRQRIHFKPPMEISRQAVNPPSLAMILGGVLSVSLLIITIARAFFYFIHRSRL